MPLHRWFDGGSLTVSDWYCRGDVLGVGREEEAATWELSIGRGGSHRVRTHEGEHVVEPMHVLCVNAGDVFRPVRRALGLDRRTRINLSAAAVRELVGEARGERPRFPARAALLPARAALAHHRLLRHAAAATRDELAVHGLALELAAHALGAAAPGGRSAAGSRQVREAVRAVQEILARRFAEPLTLAELAAEVELSPWHLSRGFRAAVGVGLHRYRTRLRLLAALERMSGAARGAVRASASSSGRGAVRASARGASAPELARLALEVGFSSHSHFTREFRGFFGAPPSRLR